MAIDRRLKNRDWSVADAAGELHVRVAHGALLAMLMDIRDELQRINAVLHCSNFLEMPRTLRAIQNKIPTRRRRTRKAAR